MKPSTKSSNSKAYYLMHDVLANTFSSRLIRADRDLDLRRLFEIGSPSRRSPKGLGGPNRYNRFVTACRIGHSGKLFVVSFRHAVPVVTMVSRDSTSAPVKKALRCYEKHLRGGLSRKKKAALATVGTVASLSATPFLIRKMLDDTCSKGVNRNNEIQKRDYSLFENTQLNITSYLAAGEFGTVFHSENSGVVIKTSTTCYTFMIEVNCLNILKDSGIVPKLYDYHQGSRNAMNLDVLFPSFGNRVVSDSETDTKVVAKPDVPLYVLVIEKLDKNVLEYLKDGNFGFDLTKILFQNHWKNIIITDYQLKKLAQKIITCLNVLDNHKILHRNFKLENIMMKKADPVIDKDFPYDVYIIDFGNAWIRTDEYSDSSIKVYGSPAYPFSYYWFYGGNPDFLKNFTWFIGSIDYEISLLEDDHRLHYSTPVVNYCKNLLKHVVQFQRQKNSR
jgi:predicted Ser/Thr protein kinase